MKMVELGSVCTITMGQAPSGDSYNGSEDGLPLIAGAGDFVNGKILPKKYTTRPTKLCKPGDIVLSIRASIGVKVLADADYCLGRGVAGLTAGPGLDGSYLWYFLSKAERELFSKGKGATFLQVNRADISELEIPLPPLDEQRRIAAILDQADAIRTKRRQTLAHLDGLAQSIFDDMFVTSSRDGRHKLGSLAAVTSGITKGRKTAEATTSVPYLAVANVQAGYLNLDTVKQIEATEQERQRYALKAGDVVLTEGGDPDKLGRGTVWRQELPECLHQNHIFRVRIEDSGAITPSLLEAFLASREAKDYFIRSAKQTTGIASINMTQLRGLPVPVPDRADQHLFETRLAKVRGGREQSERALAADDELFASLQSRAFRGEL